jgi:cytochrome c-type biogenesis protein CcmH
VPRALRRAALALLLATASSGCHRNVEPYVDEPVRQPDLSRIFPEGAERAAGDMAAAGPAAAGPPGAGAPAASGGRGAPPVASDGSPVAGTVDLAQPLAGRVPPGAILFLIARTAETGPPLAVKRIPDPEFPLEFEIGPGDRMIQAVPFAGPLQVTARIDADGNAMTREPGDLQGRSTAGLQPGDRGVEVVIDEVL